jgi:hypothetical protein
MVGSRMSARPERHVMHPSQTPSVQIEVLVVHPAPSVFIHMQLRFKFPYVTAVLVQLFLRYTTELILQLFEIIIQKSLGIGSAWLCQHYQLLLPALLCQLLTVYLRPAHFGGIFAMPDLMDFLVNSTNASVEGRTREQLQDRLVLP